MNFLEELAAEWFEWQGYFVRRNVRVEPLALGGFAGELDVVGFHPPSKHLVHLECSMDAHSWATRDARFAKKFALGRKHIPELFAGMNLPREPEAIALLGFASTRSRDMIGGGRILLVQDLLGEIICGLEGVRVASGAVPEDKPLLRTLQFVKEHKSSLFA